MPIVLTPNPIPPADGYYAKRQKILLTAGTDNFNTAFNLNNNATVADETIVQSVIDLADNYVDSRAMVLGVEKATATHYIDDADASDATLFTALTFWASRWARAQGYMLRGATNDNTDKTEGQMFAMRDEAEKRIDELLTVKLTADEDTEGAGEFGAVPVDRYGDCAVTDELSSN